MTSPVRTDVAAREARELCEVRASGCDACAVHADLYRVGYRFFPLAPEDRIAPKPVRIRAKFAGSCALCFEATHEGDPIWCTRGAKGVECDRCGSAP